VARVLEAAGGDLTRPSDAEMATDMEALGMAPLFDGSEFERI
jgi:hypothetical protein